MSAVVELATTSSATSECVDAATDPRNEPNTFFGDEDDDCDLSVDDNIEGMSSTGFEGAEEWELAPPPHVEEGGL